MRDTRPAIFPRLILSLCLGTSALTTGCAPNPANQPAEEETASAASQAPPGTDIFLVEFSEPTTAPAVRRLTDRIGYDNQPAFLPDGARLAYTSISSTPSESGEALSQADILSVDLETGAKVALTETPESEYSPTPIPGEEAISVIRVEADGAQRLWRFPLDTTNGGEPALLLPDIAPVGYHAWSPDAQELVLFVLGEVGEDGEATTPMTLQRATRGPGEGRIVGEDPGRSFHRIPGREAWSFVDKRTDDEWWISSLSFDSDQIAPIVRTLDQREDYAWSPDGSIWMGSGSRLFQWTAETGRWQEAIDLASHGVRNITRIAFDSEGRRLAVVGERPPEPAADSPAD